MASPFSFHCMICFEEFNVETRYPVVLPCGHTYVCNQCSERIDKCMECRTSLIQIIPRGPAASDPYNSNYRGGRWSSRPVASRSPGAPPPPPIKKRLPLPKNVVLMSLIEATELASENVRNEDGRASLSESPGLALPNAILDVEEEEEEKIKTGTSLAISDCGTYAVAAKEGLEIYPSRPESDGNPDQEKTEEEVDTLVRFFHLDHKLDLVQDNEQTPHPSGIEGKPAPPVRLRWGDRVQIVSTEGGWAKLARGYGFVRAGNSKLVKVGSVVDRACKLEALLRLLSERRRELRDEQKRVDNQFISLMNELQVSLMSDEDMTVIAADTFKNEEVADYVEEVKIDKIDLEQPLSQEVMRTEKCEDSTPLKPRPMERPETPPNAIESSRGFFCTSGDVFDAVIPSSSAARAPPTLPSAGPGLEALVQVNSAISSSTADSTPTRPLNSESNPTTSNALVNPRASIVESPPTRLLTAVANPSPGALRAGARAWREMHGRSASSALGVDFRTGMSGHGGLTRSSSHPHDYLEPRMGTMLSRGFSNHSGLTLWRTGRQSTRASAASLAMPMFPGTMDDNIGTFMGASQTP